jgi:hypothetical protein
MGDDGPKVEVLREDQAETWRLGMAAVQKSIEEQRPIQRAEREAARRAAQYGLRESLYFRVVKLNTREGERDRYRATCIAGLPKPDLTVYALGETPEEAVHEGRFRYAEALYKGRVEDTWEAAKARAVKADLSIADVVEE